MLETFANHLALVQEAFGVGAPAWDDALEPAKLAEILMFSFLEDIWFALISSEYTYPPIELHSVGTLQRIEGGRIIFSPHPLLYYEINTKQHLLDGNFWKTLCRVDTEKEMFCIPPRLIERRMYATARLREVGTCMLMVIQQRKPPDKFLRDVSLETLYNGLCLAVHDEICDGIGFYLERIGTFFSNGHFEPDRFLFAKIRAENNTPNNDQYPLGFPETRRKTRNLAWYWE